MALENIALENRNFYAPRFEVEIEGKKLTMDMSKAIMDVKVDEKIDEGASFTLTINDEFDMNTQEFKWLDHPLLEVGNKVTIKLGYSDNLLTMVVGKITGLEPSFFSGELPTITVNGQDLSFDYLKRPQPEKTFVDKTYSDIVREIASEAKLTPVVDDTDTFTTPIHKDNNQTYYAFLAKLAEEVGFELRIARQNMYFTEPEDDKDEILTLELGKDVISFRPTVKTSGLYSEVEVRGHNSQNPNTPIIGKAPPGSERKQEPKRRTASQIAEKRYGKVKRVISGVVVKSERHAKMMAQSRLNKASDELVKGQVQSIGIPQIRPGINIKLEKMGKLFSGKYYVKETSHTINNSGYRTQFTVKRNAI